MSNSFLVQERLLGPKLVQLRWILHGFGQFCQICANFDRVFEFLREFRPKVLQKGGPNRSGDRFLSILTRFWVDFRVFFVVICTSEVTRCVHGRTPILADRHSTLEDSHVLRKKLKLTKIGTISLWNAFSQQPRTKTGFFAKKLLIFWLPEASQRGF